MTEQYFWGRGQSREKRMGLVGWKEDKTVIISLWYDSNNITGVQCAVRLSVEQMSSPPGEQAATLSLR